jgi:hypothetical protein
MRPFFTTTLEYRFVQIGCQRVADFSRQYRNDLAAIRFAKVFVTLHGSLALNPICCLCPVEQG